MAIYHATVKAFSRGKGESGTAAAAYRAGLAIADDRTGQTYDYTRRGGVASWSMLAPEGAPEWCRDPHEFWNRSEKAESRANARVGREVEVALPCELNTDQRQALADALGRHMVERYGVAALVAVHEPHDGKGDERNHHVHILLSARKVGPDGLGERAMAEFDARKGAGADAIRDLRGQVADIINDHLAKAAIPARVDHRTLKEQASAALERGDFDQAAWLTRAPTVHEGKATTAAKRDGHVLERAAWNDAARRDNAEALAGYLAEAKKEGRVLPPQQQRPDAPARPVKQGAAVPVARVPNTGTPTIQHAHVARSATGPSAGKSKEQKHEERRQAEEAAQVNQQIAAHEALARDYLRSLEQVGMDRRKALEVAEQIGEKIAHFRGLKDQRAWREATQAWRAEQPHRTHMAGVVGYAKRKGELDHQRTQHQDGRAALSEAQDAIHRRADRMVTWEQTHPRPGVLHPGARKEWEAKRRGFRFAVECGEREAAKAAPLVLTADDLRELDGSANAVAAELARLEAERRAKWPTPSEQGDTAPPSAWAAAEVARRRETYAAATRHAAKAKAAPPRPRGPS